MVTVPQQCLIQTAERGSRDVTGRGKGSGFTGTGVDPRLVGASLGGPQFVETSGTIGSGGVERFYIGDKPPELEQGGQVGSRLGDVVNPFWSPGIQKEIIRETFGAGYDVGTLGVQQVSNNSTPQKVLKRDDYVEMDAIELFRLRCLREAEEKFRRGTHEHGSVLRSTVWGFKEIRRGFKGHSVHSCQWKHQTILCHCSTPWTTTSFTTKG